MGITYNKPCNSANQPSQCDSTVQGFLGYIILAIGSDMQELSLVISVTALVISLVTLYRNVKGRH